LFITHLDYKYDALENRIEKDVTANSVVTVTRFAVDGGNVWADLNNSNVLQTRRLFLDNVDRENRGQFTQVIEETKHVE
jgi:hypothetical protein